MMNGQLRSYLELLPQHPNCWARIVIQTRADDAAQMNSYSLPLHSSLCFLLLLLHMLFVFDYLLLSSKFPGLNAKTSTQHFLLETSKEQEGTDRFLATLTGFLLLLKRCCVHYQLGAHMAHLVETRNGFRLLGSSVVFKRDDIPMNNDGERKPKGIRFYLFL